MYSHLQPAFQMRRGRPVQIESGSKKRGPPRERQAWRGCQNTWVRSPRQRSFERRLQIADHALGFLDEGASAARWFAVRNDRRQPSSMPNWRTLHATDVSPHQRRTRWPRMAYKRSLPEERGQSVEWRRERDLTGVRCA